MDYNVINILVRVACWFPKSEERQAALPFPKPRDEAVSADGGSSRAVRGRCSVAQVLAPLC